MKIAKTTMWLCILSILVIGMSTIFSVTRYSSDGIRGSFNNQLKFLIIGIVLTILASRLPAKFWKTITPFAYIGTLVSLGAVLVIGQKVNGAQSWIRLPGLSIQPSEFLKFSLVLALASILAKTREQTRLQDFFLVCITSAIPLGLILLQPDLGTTMTLVPMIVGMCYLAGYNLPNLGMLIGFGTLGFMTLIIGAIQQWSWIPIHTYQLGRIVRLLYQDDFSPLLWLGRFDSEMIMTVSTCLGIIALIFAKSWRKLIWVLLILGHAYPFYSWTQQSPEQREIVNENFIKPFRNRQQIEEPQLRSAKHALANGRYFGMGYRQGEQTQYQRLPYAYSDLIFAAFAEEWGFVGSIILMGFYTVLVCTMLYMSHRIGDPFSSLCISGSAFMLMAQVFIHVGYTTGILPMTGITLPFMSAGGSALVTALVGMALVHGCATKSEETSI